MCIRFVLLLLERGDNADGASLGVACRYLRISTAMEGPGKANGSVKVTVSLTPFGVDAPLPASRSDGLTKALLQVRLH